MGNWDIENLDGTRMSLENVCFQQQVRLPNGSFSQSIPLDKNRISIQTEGGNTIAINSDGLSGITRTDDGVMFTHDNQRLCGSPSLLGRIVLSGFSNGNSVTILLDDIQNATMREDLEITEGT